MKLILRYLKKYKALVLLNLVGVLGFALVELGIPTIMATVIDKGIAYNVYKENGNSDCRNFYIRGYGKCTFSIYFS